MQVRLVLLLIAFSLESVSAQAGIRVVSDIDDTTKITNVGDPVIGAWNALFTSRAFAGMSELYSTLALERAYTYEYLTGAPEILGGKVRGFLERNGFPQGEIHLRPLFGSGSLREFKTHELEKIMTAHPEDHFIFIGDDGQHDADVYNDVFRMSPDRILSIYIRTVTNRPLPPSEYSFLSAFDIARTEYIMGRLEASEVAPTALAIIAEPRDRRIMPEFTYCPVAQEAFGIDPRVEKWTKQIFSRIEKICEARHLESDWE